MASAGAVSTSQLPFGSAAFGARLSISPSRSHWQHTARRSVPLRQCRHPWRQHSLAWCPTSAAGSSHIDETPILSDKDALNSDGQPDSSSNNSGGNSGSRRRDAWRVPIPLQLHGKAPRRHWNANALAFLGDSVWELYARRRFFYPPSRKDSYIASVIQHVRAETQEQLYKQLLESGFLTDAERDVLRWGRNATGVTPERLSNTGLKRETYRAATALECLCGYLYLSDPQRLHGMMCLLDLGDAPPDGSLGGSSSSSVDGSQDGEG